MRLVCISATLATLMTGSAPVGAAASPQWVCVDVAESAVAAERPLAETQAAEIPVETTIVEPPAVRQLIEAAFPVEHLETALRVAACESSFMPDAVNRSSGATGVFQFMRKTWTWVCDNAQVDCDHDARLDPVQNIRAAAFLVDAPGGGWRHWECK